jgi:hypothetical protein
MITLIVLSIILLLWICFTKTRNLSLSIVLCIIVHSILVWFASELLSLLNLFNYNHISLFWALTLVLEIGWLIRKQLSLNDFSHFKNLTLQSIKISLINNKLLFFLFCSFITLLFIQGIIYPPNNWDSLTYHMARIPHWIINENLSPYPTNIYRQIYSPPLSELLIGHVCILTKSDYYANSIQLVFLIGILALFNLACNELSNSKSQKIVVLTLAILTPSVLLEASSTQNDLITSFFILSTLLFIYYYYKSNTFKNTLLIGVTAGLACYTKGTSYIFLLPILAFWVFYSFRKTKEFGKTIKNYMIAITSFIVINSFYFYRNFKLTGDIFGKNEDHLFNERMNVKIFIVNSCKNIGNHFSIPKVNQVVNQFIEKIHITFKIDITDFQTNFNSIGFKLLPWQHHEDTVSNFFQILVLIIGVVLFFIKLKRTSKITKLLFSIMIFELILFNLLLKWQPWHTRLSIPIFFIAFLFLTSLIKDIRLFRDKIPYFTLFTVSLYALVIVILNPTRPFITSSQTARVAIKDGRFKKYTANYLALENDYKVAILFLKQHSDDTSLELGGDMWEYLFFKNVFESKNNFYPKNIIGIENQTKKLIEKKIPTKYIISYKTEIKGYEKLKSLKLFNFYQKSTPF